MTPLYRHHIRVPLATGRGYVEGDLAVYRTPRGLKQSGGLRRPDTGEWAGGVQNEPLDTTAFVESLLERVGLRIGMFGAEELPFYI